MDIIKAAIIGGAIGDAMGVPYEFKSRLQMEENPATVYAGHGTHHQLAGTWSDDTGLTIASLDAIAESFDYEKVMKNFVKWLYDGEYTAHGIVFDAGRATLLSIQRYMNIKLNPIECGEYIERANGNGSLMRIMPFVLYCYFHLGKRELDSEVIEIIYNASSLTHAHYKSKVSCAIYCAVAMGIIEKPCKSSIKQKLMETKMIFGGTQESICFEYLWQEEFLLLSRDKIKSSGYVIDSLEASIWCVLTTDSYMECILKAINLGGDTDTIASLSGGLAGLLYGYDGIPEEVKNGLIKREYLEEICEKFEKSIGNRKKV